jgi:hypothetical protein
MTKESNGMKAEKMEGRSSEWTPSTHHQTPQPAGSDCAAWYERCNPGAEDLLYALAHTKGDADKLREALLGLVCATEETLRAHPETSCCVITKKRCEAARAALTSATGEGEE